MKDTASDADLLWSYKGKDGKAKTSAFYDPAAWTSTGDLIGSAWLVDGYIPAHGVYQLIAKEGNGKTMMLLSLAFAASLGRSDWLG